ncbi:killer cell lectin-like receptor 2 isoform X2 [Callorhinus ursinus]|uniref:killer cell lectin-like receptor 2 isoform X2 n=1 Tax=Callorhinus ursinus TaxID=34884 RepID=UPI003CD015DD
MSNQQVIYSTLRFLQSSSESPNRLRPRRTQRPGKNDGKVFQYIQENHQLGEVIGNLTREHHILQNDSYLKEQLLTNMISEYNILKNESLQQKKEQDLLFADRRCQRGNEGKLYENRWSCCGIKCYYFIPESKNWNGCKQTCQSYNSSLLKINDEDELAFIQPQTYRNNYWIGLSYDDREQKWKWIDTGPPFGINYTFMSSSGRGQCAFLTPTRITPIECSKTYNCICEERIDDIFSACFNRYKKKREKAQESTSRGSSRSRLPTGQRVRHRA